MMTKSKFKICDMHCVSCAMNIDFDLEDVDGVNYSKTNYATCECEVEYDPVKVDKEKIISQVQKTGYKAEALQD